MAGILEWSGDILGIGASNSGGGIVIFKISGSLLNQFLLTGADFVW